MSARFRAALLITLAVALSMAHPALADPPEHTVPLQPPGVSGDMAKPSVPPLQGADVNVSNLAGNEAEVSIDINPTDPLSQVIVGHAPGFATMNTFFTTDGGQTWTLVALGNAVDGFTSTFRFDPTLAFDDDGNVYVGYGVRWFDAAGDRHESVVVCRSTDGGQTYPQSTTVATTPSIVLPSGDLFPANDKWHLATGPDPSNPGQLNVYIAWTQNITEGSDIDQRLVVSASTDAGATFSAPVIIADDAIAGIDRALFGDPAVGPNGELYVSWHDFGAGELRMDVSTDAGATWGTDRLITTVNVVGLDDPIPAQPDREVPPGPTIDADRSGEAFDGRLYITYMDFVGGSATDTDVFVRFSDDDGASWSAATTVNDDAGTNSQFLPWLDVDQASGLVSVVWYDARNDVGNQLVEVFHSVSDDGGATFGANTVVSDGQSDQSANNPSAWSNNFLEYIGVTSLNCAAYVVWADNSLNPADLDYFFDHVGLEDGPPDIVCPGDIDVECTEVGGTPASNPAIVGFLGGASATDGCDPDVEITNDAPAFFPVGPTVVTFTATDDAGNESSCLATVTVEDTTPPDITCPGDVTVECSAWGGTPRNDPQLVGFFAGVSATDVCCGATVVITDDGPALFPLGDTVVTFTAEDCNGNQNSCTATVTVIDTTPPEITVELNRYVLWPPNHRMVDIVATVTTSDICCATTFELTSIVSNEPPDDIGDGNTEPDIQGAEFGTPDVEFQLRSERSGLGEDRIYTIVYTAEDCAGNTAACTVEVRVPHDQHHRVTLVGEGFNDDATDLLTGAEEYTLIIPSDPVFDPRGVNVEQAYVGNHFGAIAPVSHALIEINADGIPDLELAYDAVLTRALRDLSTDSEGVYPVGMHYQTADGNDYLVDDIFALGAYFTGVPEADGGGVVLFRPAPNPLVESTRMAYAVRGASRARVKISVYNVAGQLIRKLVDAEQDPGVYHVTWDGRTDAGTRVRSGVYFMSTAVGDQVRRSRLTVVR